MVEITKKQHRILFLVLQKGIMSSSDMHAALQATGEDMSLVTVKRALSEMVQADILQVQGAGPSTQYAVATLGRIFADINAAEYCAVPPDTRWGFTRYNFDLLPALPRVLYSSSEQRFLDEATQEYHRRTHDLSPTIQKKELERLVIELAWKSSRIEGNTYTLLDTEKLILEHKEAPGHAANEAHMILNHKDAFTYIYEHKGDFTTLTRANVQNVHALLVNNLGVGLGLREKPVGVMGSKYQPLDNIHQITDAMEALSAAVTRMATPYAKALVALVGLSYIQPFEDGNKRTARLMANALLLAHGCAPLSYRSVDEAEYRNALLLWYEVNAVLPFKKIFLEQYDFAARNYLVK